MNNETELYRYVTTHLEQSKCARTSSKELIQLVVSHGDTDAFAALTQRHGPEVYRWCQFFLRNKADAEDLFQDVFLTLWVKCSKVRDASKLDGWLFRIVRNKALNRLRSRKHVTMLDTVEPVAALQHDGDPAASKEQLEIVMRELGNLRSEYQEALLLTKVQGLTLEAAAKQMGRPLGTVSTFINRGLEELVQRLAIPYRVEFACLGSHLQPGVSHRSTRIVETNHATGVGTHLFHFAEAGLRKQAGGAGDADGRRSGWSRHPLLLDEACSTRCSASHFAHRYTKKHFQLESTVLC